MLDDYLKIYHGSRRILFVGSYPPPLGGVSVHIYRLVKLLKANSYKPFVFNTYRALIHNRIKHLVLLVKIVFRNYQVIHVHNSRVKVFKTILVAKKFKDFRLIFTDHNPRLFEGLKDDEIKIVKRFLDSCDLLIAVAPHVVENYKKVGGFVYEKQIIMNAFLPPPIDEEEQILKTYPSSLLTFINQRNPVIVGNAYQLNFQDGVDLYGLDLCIEVIRRLRVKFGNIICVYAIANDKYNSDYLTKMKNLVTEYKLSDNFFFLIGQRELWPLLKKADLLLRPTNSDGDAVSIREARYFNTPVIASDICVRIEGVTTFKSRDIDDLYNKMLDHFSLQNNEHNNERKDL